MAGDVDVPKIKISETVTLQKFEGDPTQEEKDSGVAKPVETIVIKDGERIFHSEMVDGELVTHLDKTQETE
jgi:hypothetical protein